MTTALLHDNAGFFSYGDAVYPPLRDAHFPDVMGRLPLASWFRWWRGMESMEKHGKLWGCMGRFIRLGKSLAKPGKRDHPTAQGALPVSCSSCLAGNQPVQIQQIWIRWIPIFFLLRVFGANLLHCLYFSQNKKKTTREPSAHSKPLTKDSSIPFACHAKENIVFIRAVARLCQIPGLAFLQSI